MRARTARLITVGALALGISLAAVPAASAEFHRIKVRDVAGEVMTDNESFIELQMYDPGQNQVSGHEITFWDADALVLGMPVPVAELPLTGSNPPNAQSQRSILIGDTGVTGRDFTLDLTPFLDGDEGGNLTAAGAVCFEAIPVDCVSWGGTDFTGAANLPDQTTPYDNPLTTLLGVSGLHRSIGAGTCPTALDAADDTNNANADFARPGLAPTPNSATPVETVCAPPPAAQPTTPATKRKKCKKPKKRAATAKKKCKKKRKSG